MSYEKRRVTDTCNKNFQSLPLAPKERLPVARELGETSLMFLCHPTLTDDHVAKTCESLKAVMQSAAG